MNSLQRIIAQEWAEGIQKDDSVQGQRKLKKLLSQRYQLSIAMIEGVIKFAATEGLTEIKNKNNKSIRGHGYTYELVDYVEIIGDVKQKVEAL